MRLRRSCLAVPGAAARMVEKARALPADEVFLDLEDAVAPADKTDRTRQIVVDALRAEGWRAPTRAVRVNGVTTRWCFRDVAFVVDGAREHLHSIVVPKVHDASHVHFVDHLLTQLELDLGLPHGGIALELLIETAHGALELPRIAAASPRTEALVFGPGDFAASLGIPQLSLGAIEHAYPGDQWHYALSRLTVSARAHGLQAIDGPYAQIRDLDGLRASAQRSRLLGLNGKWALHPDQLAPLNEIYSPSQAQFDRALDILEAYRRAVEVEHRGAVMLDGEMIDEASRQMALQIEAAGREAGLERGRPGVTVPALRELGLSADQEDLVLGVRAFVDGEVIPRAAADERADRFPQELVDGLRELGMFGLTIPERYGGSGIDLVTYCAAVEELARGWMSLAGIVNTHFVVSAMLLESGTEEQRARLLPPMARGEIRGAFSMSEPHCGSDVQAIRTVARRDGDGYVIDGRKMWVTNGLRAGIVAVLVKTDPAADPPHRGMTAFLLEKEPGAERHGGITVPPPLHKLGYRGVETTELVLDAHRVPAGAVLGGADGVGRGFQQMMSGIEVGRANVAARGVGVARRAFELALAYAREREAFGRPLTDHQAIGFRLADMATQIEAARLLTVRAARAKQEGRRADLETGMAKLYASEACADCVEQAMRIHGGYGYSTEYEIERLYRDAPLLLVGEGTSEIQKTIIARSLVRGGRG